MTAMVTGAGGALGGAIALRLAVDGHAVAVVDIDGESAARTAEQIEGAGGVALVVECDLRSPDAIEDAFNRTRSDLGPISVLVNNAAVFPSGTFVDIPVEEHDDTIAVNQRGYFLCSQRAARSMIGDGRGGSIVNIASITWHGYWIESSGLTRYGSTPLHPERSPPGPNALSTTMWRPTRGGFSTRRP
jgi:NAD(P)-dependent dehydrogenase (short-subunit alcohol dehydrogenase family)